MAPVFKNVAERSTAKNYCPVSLVSVISKVFEKLIDSQTYLNNHLQDNQSSKMTNAESAQANSYTIITV